jgi:hypothetical protein
VALALGLAGCGGDDDFANDPRPPSPIDLTASIGANNVSVSPSEFGAGLVTITIANLTDEPARLTLEGPTDVASGEIVPGGTGSVKANLEEGEYEASAGAEPGIRPDTIVVGPERESSSDQLLQP